jgi:hypothetical protein
MTTEELEVLKQILSELKEANRKLDDIERAIRQVDSDIMTFAH